MSKLIIFLGAPATGKTLLLDEIAMHADYADFYDDLLWYHIEADRLEDDIKTKLEKGINVWVATQDRKVAQHLLERIGTSAFCWDLKPASATYSIKEAEIQARKEANNG